MHVKQRAWHALVDAHHALGSCRMVLFDMVPDDDFIHQLLVSVPYLLVVALGTREYYLHIIISIKLIKVEPNVLVCPYYALPCMTAS